MAFIVATGFCSLYRDPFPVPQPTCDFILLDGLTADIFLHLQRTGKTKKLIKPIYIYSFISFVSVCLPFFKLGICPYIIDCSRLLKDCLRRHGSYFQVDWHREATESSRQGHLECAAF